jgi:hypothetical protein
MARDELILGLGLRCCDGLDSFFTRSKDLRRPR